MGNQMNYDEILTEELKDYPVNTDYFVIDDDGKLIWNKTEYTIKKFIIIPEENFIMSEEEFNKVKEKVEEKIRQYQKEKGENE